MISVKSRVFRRAGKLSVFGMFCNRMRRITLRQRLLQFLTVTVLSLLSNSDVISAERNAQFVLDGFIPTPNVKRLPPPWRFNNQPIADQPGIWKFDLANRNSSTNPHSMCIELFMLRESKFSHPLTVRGKLRGPGVERQIGTAECNAIQKKGDSQAWTLFHVYAVSDKKARRGALSVSAVFDDTQLHSVENIQWTLLSSGKSIGGYGAGGYSKSFWGADIDQPNAYALYLVDESESGSSVVASPVTKSTNPRGKDLSVLSVSGFASADVPIGDDSSAAPRIKWNGNETINNLYLEVLESASDPRQGRYCIRPVYQAGQRYNYRTIARDGSSWRVSANSPVPYQQLNSPSNCMATDAQLLFELFVNASGTTFKKKVRLRIFDKSKGKLTDFSQTTIDLVDYDSGRTVYASSGPGNNQGKWVIGRNGAVVVLAGKNARNRAARVSIVSEQSIEGYYFNEVGPDNKSRVDGGSDLFFDLEAGADSFRLDLEKQESSKELKALYLCLEEDCASQILTSVSVTTFPADVSLGNVQSAQYYLVFDWKGEMSAGKKVTNVSTSQASPTKKANDIRLAPQIAFGSYIRPLTACVGRFISTEGNEISDNYFSLRQGLQYIKAADVPGEVNSNPDKWRIAFDQTKKGTKCPAPDLGDISFGEVANRASEEKGPIKAEFSTKQELFVGYLHLSKKDYRDSLIRWVETLNFFNKLYEFGRSKPGGWVDGVVYGPTENDDEVTGIIEPSSNFVKSLSIGSGLESTAEALLDRAYNVSNFTSVSEDQLTSIRKAVGDARITLVYFDDNSFGCDDYKYNLESADLNAKNSVIIASTDEYIPDLKSDSTLGNGLVGVCKSDKALRVYIFNSREVNGNKVWDKALDVIFEDLKKWN